GAIRGRHAGGLKGFDDALIPDDVPVNAIADAGSTTTRQNEGPLRISPPLRSKFVEDNRFARVRGREVLNNIGHVVNAARLDRGARRPLVDPNRPHGAVTVGSGAPSLALVRMPTFRFCPAGLEATGNAAGERRSPSRSWGTGQARK